MSRVALDHVVLEVHDAVRSVRFYRDVLGLRPVRLREFAAGLTPFPSSRITRDSVLDFFPPPMWGGKRPSNPNHFCLSYSRAGIAALRRRLRRRSIAIEREDPRSFGARGFGVALYFRDPDGLLLEARHYPGFGRRTGP